MNKRTRYIAQLGLLTAIVIVLQLISNYVTLGVVNINLALVAIIIGACILGPVAGLWLGIINGIIVCLAPTTAPFIAHNLFMTIVVCLLKTGLAGFVSGWVYILINKLTTFRFLSVIVSSIVVPIVNTSLFMIGAILFFVPVYGGGSDGIMAIVTTTLTINFLIEFITTIALSIAIDRVILLVKKKNTTY